MLLDHSGYWPVVSSSRSDSDAKRTSPSVCTLTSPVNCCCGLPSIKWSSRCNSWNQRLWMCSRSNPSSSTSHPCHRGCEYIRRRVYVSSTTPKKTFQLCQYTVGRRLSNLVGYRCLGRGLIEDVETLHGLPLLRAVRLLLGIGPIVIPILTESHTVPVPVRPSCIMIQIITVRLVRLIAPSVLIPQYMMLERAILCSYSDFWAAFIDSNVCIYSRYHYSILSIRWDKTERLRSK